MGRKMGLRSWEIYLCGDGSRDVVSPSSYLFVEPPAAGGPFESSNASEVPSREM